MASSSIAPPFRLDDPSLFKQQSFVNGEWVESASGARFDVIDPGTGATFAHCPINDIADVDNALLLRWYELITAAKNDIATIVTYETGKPLSQALAEVNYALGFVWWFAGEAERAQGTVGYSAIPNRRTITIKQPIGVSVALVPWNLPVAMILRKASAALAAGCTMIIKPSPETPLSVLALVELAVRAGFDKGVLTVMTTDLQRTPSLSEGLCKHPLVRKVTFTGSTRIGKLISHHCSDGLKKLTLELGGNCPFVVFDDADVGKAIDTLMQLKWSHSGQACITANRVYIQQGIYDEFLRLFVDKTKKLKIGHGAVEGTTLGPLTTPGGVDKVETHVQDAISHGGRIALGGTRPSHGNGFFYPATVISEANDKMLVAAEETFGPLCALFRFDTEDEAVGYANNTSLGLASYVFTRDVSRIWRLLETLEAGMVGLNTGNQSAAELPFGGIKESGYGKESGKDMAINEYLITKSATLTLDEVASVKL